MTTLGLRRWRHEQLRNGASMALSNAERQSRHRHRVKEKLRNAGNGDPLRNADPYAEILKWLGTVDQHDDDRIDFLRKLGPLIADRFVPKSWFEDCAFEIHLARGTEPPEPLRRKKLHVT